MFCFFCATISAPVRDTRCFDAYFYALLMLLLFISLSTISPSLIMLFRYFHYVPLVSYDLLQAG